MKRIFLPAAIFLFLAGGNVALPQDATVATQANKQVASKLIDEFSTEAMRLDDFVKELQKKAGDALNISLVVEELQKSPKLPTVPAIKAKRVHMQQLAEWLSNACPGVIVKNISAGEANPMIVITYSPLMVLDTEKINWRAFRISDVVNIQYAKLPEGKDAAAKKDLRKLALNQILSVVQASLRLADESIQPTVQVHEETEMLLIKGTAEQAKVVEALLETLRPKEMVDAQKDKQIELLKQEKSQILRLMEIANRDAGVNEQRLGEVMRQNLELIQQNERLKVRLEILEGKEKRTTTAPKD